MKALITRKVGMTSIIDADGSSIAVTLLSASPCVVTQLKTLDVDGYQAVQIGFEKGKSLSRSLKGHFKPSKLEPKIVREFRVDEISELKVGDTVEGVVRLLRFLADHARAFAVPLHRQDGTAVLIALRGQVTRSALAVLERVICGHSTHASARGFVHFD